ncbi:MAG TPA: hypothetical protein VIR16_12505 [Candidatus Limnocylindrales bacterium]
MPNFHPQLVASVAPLLEPGEEVWAVYPAKPRSLVATATRLFLVSPVGTSALPLREFALMRRPRPSLVLLQRRAGGAMRIALDPLDEHGIQALTVIGLLVANVARPHAVQPNQPAPARAAPAPRHRLATHRFVLRDGRAAVTAKRGWTAGWATSAAPPTARSATHRRRRAFRLGPNRRDESAEA